MPNPVSPGPTCVRYLLPTRRQSLPEESAAGSAPTATHWTAMTRLHLGRAASTAPSACPPRRPSLPLRASQRTSPTGTLYRAVHGVTGAV